MTQRALKEKQKVIREEAEKEFRLKEKGAGKGGRVEEDRPLASIKIVLQKLDKGWTKYRRRKKKETWRGAARNKVKTLRSKE